MDSVAIKALFTNAELARYTTYAIVLAGLCVVLEWAVLSKWGREKVKARLHLLLAGFALLLAALGYYMLGYTLWMDGTIATIGAILLLVFHSRGKTSQ